MSDSVNIGAELLELINSQEEMLIKQNKIISHLVGDNLEKENMINVLMQECDGMY